MCAAFASGRSAGYRMMQVLQRKPEIDPNGTDAIVLADIKGDIEISNVYFSYPSRPDQLIFDGFTLHILCGKTMAIVGESGNGKSTVINLVERFYDPQAGEVLIDGVNIKSLRLGWLRGKSVLSVKSHCCLPLVSGRTLPMGKKMQRMKR